MTETFICPICGAESSNPYDALEGYCGACHDWTRERRSGLRYYDRDGKPITMRRWVDLSNDLAYCNVRMTAVNDEVSVSTIWLGLDHGFGSSTPVIFETMVFGGPLDQQMERYSTLIAAEAGHERWVAAARAGGVHGGG